MGERILWFCWNLSCLIPFVQINIWLLICINYGFDRKILKLNLIAFFSLSLFKRLEMMMMLKKRSTKHLKAKQHRNSLIKIWKKSSTINKDINKNDAERYPVDLIITYTVHTVTKDFFFISLSFISYKIETKDLIFIIGSSPKKKMRNQTKSRKWNKKILWFIIFSTTF